MRLLNHVLQFYFTYPRENCIRCRAATSGANRGGSAREVVETHVRLAAFHLYLHRIRRRVERDPSPCTDPAMAPTAGEIPAVRRKKEVLTATA